MGTRRLDMSPSNARARERLEIDGDDERVNPFIIDRARVSDDDDDSRANATGPPKITATAPSPLLARLATFLPTMERANEALRGKSASEVCVETTTEDSDEARIEMDLGLGVVDLKTERAVRVAAAKAGVADGDRRGAAGTREEENRRIVMRERE